MTRTFVDSGVLIAAACGLPEIAARAMQFLDDPDRVFVTSDFLRLEVMPKPWYHGFKDQVESYQVFFSSARKMPVSKKLLENAIQEAFQFGLGACDAIHVAVARRGKCVELVTTEKPSKPLFRIPDMTVTSLQRLK